MIDNKTQRILLGGNNGWHYYVDLPMQCPHCSTIVRPVVQSTVQLYNNNEYVYYASALQPGCCDEIYFSLTRKKISSPPTNTDGLPCGELLSIYPTGTGVLLPDYLDSVSPNFCKMYKQAHRAEDAGDIELAGTGYRNALEILVKDYAIGELQIPPDEVISKNLNQAIQHYLDGKVAVVSADQIRKIGNDYTHYNQKYEYVQFETLKKYLDMLIRTLEYQYLIDHPATENPPSQTNL